MEIVNQGIMPRSVLVVEDDRAISRLLRSNLETKDTHVFEAATGLDCVRILQETNIDLVLLDLRLPDFNGWGILSLLRLTEPLSDMPVIIVSVEPPDRGLMEKLHPDDYIQKPFDMSNLLARVRRVIGRRSLS
ncbi:MAG: DNA-binding response regulator [Dehalococcoidales bacterium]|nr:DNA-binding response regulator [Dehalococcoidales bacterium]